MEQPTVEVMLARSGQAKASLVVGRDSPPFYRWVAGELQRYLQDLSGAELPVMHHDEVPVGKALILVGGPAANPLSAAAQEKGLVSFAGLEQDGFILQSGVLGGAPIVLAGGSDEASTMYAAYELLERLEAVFQLTGDIIPRRAPDLKLPALSVRMEPALRYRGLHMRHFVMPWMGLDDFRRMIDQMAKLKYNYLEFYWYVGGPWIEYSHQGEKRQIDGLYTRDSGYLTWHHTADRFKAPDVKIGREHFKRERVCAPEFATVQNQEEAHQVAREWLRQAIDYAHHRKIQIWLGKGDCPFVPPNLGRHSPLSRPDRWDFFGTAMAPGDPVGAEIWEAMVNSMIETYPEADGYWIWLAEAGTIATADPESQEVLHQYDSLRNGASDSDMGLVHFGKEVVERVKQRHPRAQLGLALLNRCHLFRALDTLVPKDVAFQSMESGACWHPGVPVPMERFGGLEGRQTFLVPRLDDDQHEFAMQFNAALYEFDRVLAGSVQYGVAGVAPQTGKLRGLEQNARFIGEGAWNPALTTAQFYEGYLRRIFGEAALEEMLKAYNVLQENDHTMGWRGLYNFCNYAAMEPIKELDAFREDPLQKGELPQSRRDLAAWRDGFADGTARLREALGHLERARPAVLPGSRHELEYVIFKTESYILHLETIRALLDGCIAYGKTVSAKQEGQGEDALRRLEQCRASFTSARELSLRTAQLLAARAEDPDEEYILFRYNMYFVRPIEAFCDQMVRWSP
jgi:hypothetical protein